MDSRIQNTTPATTTTPAAASTSKSGSNNGSTYYRTEEARVMDNGQWCITVCPTIGGHFQLQVGAQDTVDGLKKVIGKRLKIQREKISLLYRERLLSHGTLAENGIHEGCKITLLPNVESGLVPPKPEHTVLQALENLSDSQVNAFLAGRSPLTLAMRLGEHMMFVQLQLSTSPPSLKHNHHPPHRCLRKSAPYPQHVPSTASRAPSSDRRSSTAHGAFSRTAVAADHSRTAGDGRTSGPRTGGATLSEAKQNLSQKLKEFSQVARTQGDETADTPAAQRPSTSSSSSSSSTSSSSPYSSQAIIESMEQVGQGVYSGTFSGTLNPALQDHDGRPKRSVSTIIHILNDLLGASPEYRAHRRARRINRQEAAHFAKPADSRQQSQENQATRGKMEYLQMMLQERRNRRQARKERRSCPYPTINPHPVSVGSSSQGGSTSFGFDTNVDAAANMTDAASGYAQMMQENEAELTQGAVVV